MRTRTELCTTRLVVGSAGGRCRFTSEGGPFRAVLQASQGTRVRVALVPDRALLLAGDRVRLEVTVAAGTHLHLVETSGTVAYDMRGGDAAWEVAVEVGAGGSFVHETLPWVSAAGSDVRRTTELVLATDAGALVRETLVLGRHGETPGRLTSRTVVRRGGRDVLVEQLDSRDLAPARVLDGVLWVGEPCIGSGGDCVVAQPGVTRLETETGEVLHRALATEAHVAAAGVDRVWASLVGSLPTPGCREHGSAAAGATGSRSGGPA